MKDQGNTPHTRKRRKWGSVIVRKNADGKTVTYRGAWSSKKSISTK